MDFLRKVVGGGQRPPRVGIGEIAIAWGGSFLAIAFIGLLERAVFGPGQPPLLIGSMGASAVLAFGAIRSPLAQPRNLVGGHVVSALTGVTVGLLLPEPLWLSAALAVSLAIALMHMTQTLHPPGGATALIAIIGGDSVRQLGYGYVLCPCLLGACLLLAVALLVNNIPKNRRYPLFWW